MAAHIEAIMWVILITATIITAIAMAKQCKFTRPAKYSTLPVVEHKGNAAIVTTGQLVAITVEHSGKVGPGMLRLAAYQELASDSKSYKMLYSVGGDNKQTFYFTEA